MAAGSSRTSTARTGGGDFSQQVRGIFFRLAGKQVIREIIERNRANRTGAKEIASIHATSLHAAKVAQRIREPYSFIVV
jgi:hypothetical protein